MKRSSLYLSKQSLNFSSEIPKEELDQIECHFNWNVVNSAKSHAYYVDRIAVFDGHLSGGELRNLAQIYAAKGYFAYLYYIQQKLTNPKEKNEESIQKAEECMLNALRKSSEENKVGYQLVIYGNLAHLHNAMENYEKAKDYLDKYKGLELSLIHI